MPTKGRPKRSADIACVCETCGVGWLKPEWSKSGTKYCSKACYDQSRRGKPRPERRIEPIEAICGGCAQPFLTGGRGRRRYGARFCSRVCQGVGTSSHPPLRQMSPEEVAWMAGLFDGEGNIAWPRKGHVYAVRVSIANTCFPLLERIKVVTGTGAIVCVRNHKNPKHSPTANWACTGDRARDIIRVMLPWLIVKRENTEIVLEAVDAWREGRAFERLPIPSGRR